MKNKMGKEKGYEPLASLSELPKIVTEFSEGRILVVFDLDDTLIRPVSNHFGSYDMFLYILRIFFKGSDKYEAYELWKVPNEVAGWVNFEIVEDGVLEVWKELKEMKNVSVIVMTSRDHQSVEFSKRQMIQCGFDVEKENDVNVLFEEDKRVCVMENNDQLVFCSLIQKDRCLSSYLTNIWKERIPDHIVFVDDQPKHCKAISGMGKELRNCNISSFLFRKEREYDSSKTESEFDRFFEGNPKIERCKIYGNGERKEYLGWRLSSRVFLEEVKNHRLGSALFLFSQNKNGSKTVLLQRRCKNKSVSPSCFDFTSAGHMNYDEGSENWEESDFFTCMKRENDEELFRMKENLVLKLWSSVTLVYEYEKLHEFKKGTFNLGFKVFLAFCESEIMSIDFDQHLMKEEVGGVCWVECDKFDEFYQKNKWTEWFEKLYRERHIQEMLSFDPVKEKRENFILVDEKRYKKNN